MSNSKHWKLLKQNLEPKHRKSEPIIVSQHSFAVATLRRETLFTDGLATCNCVIMKNKVCAVMGHFDYHTDIPTSLKIMFRHLYGRGKERTTVYVIGDTQAVLRMIICNCLKEMGLDPYEGALQNEDAYKRAFEVSYTIGDELPVLRQIETQDIENRFEYGVSLKPDSFYNVLSSTGFIERNHNATPLVLANGSLSKNYSHEDGKEYIDIIDRYYAALGYYAINNAAFNALNHPDSLKTLDSRQSSSSGETKQFAPQEPDKTRYTQESYVERLEKSSCCHIL